MESIFVIWRVKENLTLMSEYKQTQIVIENRNKIYLPKVLIRKYC